MSGHDLRSYFILKKLRRGSASMLFLVKFFFLGGVSFSRFILVKCGPSQGLSLMNTHSSKNAFFKASSIGIYFTNILILSVAFPFSDVITCWCGTIAAMFSQIAQRHSHDLYRFFSLLNVPSRW